jgi:hypothetical protein
LGFEAVEVQVDVEGFGLFEGVQGLQLENFQREVLDVLERER